MHLKEHWEDGLLPLTYNLSRYISFLQMHPEQDIAINLFFEDKKHYLRDRYKKSIDSYRSALEQEMHWNLNKYPNDRINYSTLMHAVGFFSEELKYVEQAMNDFPENHEFAERVKKIYEFIGAVESKGKHEIQINGIHKISPFLAEFGQRYRLDEIIEQNENEFWNEVVLGFDPIISEEIVRELFPKE